MVGKLKKLSTTFIQTTFQIMSLDYSKTVYNRTVLDSRLHRNFIIFGQVDLDWHWDKGRLLQKTDPREQDVPNPTIYLLTQSLIFLTMELADRPTKFQHSLQKSNSHMNIIINQLGTQKFTPHF